jgi:hypothetical protein
VERARGTAVPLHTLVERATERAFHLGSHITAWWRRDKPVSRQKWANLVLLCYVSRFRVAHTELGLEGYPGLTDGNFKEHLDSRKDTKAGRR